MASSSLNLISKIENARSFHKSSRKRSLKLIVKSFQGKWEALNRNLFASFVKVHGNDLNKSGRCGIVAKRACAGKIHLICSSKCDLCLPLRNNCVECFSFEPQRSKRQNSWLLMTLCRLCRWLVWNEIESGNKTSKLYVAKKHNQEGIFYQFLDIFPVSFVIPIQK